MALNKWDKQHLINLGLTQRHIDEIFNTAAKEAAAIGVSLDDFNPDKPFSFADYPETKARIEKLVKSLQNNVETVIVNGTRSGWTLANNKNNVLCDRVFGDNKYKLTREQERKYYNNNDKALEAFIKRKTAGLNLSDRVWTYADQFKNEIEMGLDLGIRNGLSAVEMARDLKKYLREPDRLFRRVRDEDGKLQLSKAAKAYNPGAGHYRSSYKNSMRLARTENNIAYRTSDHERWQQLDFVVGIEIRLSNNHTLNGQPFTDICDLLQGKYPKDFKFTGWHPQCRCHAVSVLKTQEELVVDTQKILNGEEPDTESVNTIKDVPGNFKKWTTDNKDRIEAAEQHGTLPYFMKDNKAKINKILKTSSIIYNSVDELPERLKKQLIEYTTNTAYEVNYYLRNGEFSEGIWKEIKEKVPDIINGLDEIFKTTKLESGVYYRGLSFSKFREFSYENFMSNIKIGEEFMDKAYMSSSSSFDVVKNAYINKNGVIFNIKGKALSIQSVSEVKGEQEFLFNRNTKFTVKSINKKEQFTEIILEEKDIR